jgi:hypothetical protein
MELRWLRWREVFEYRRLVNLAASDTGDERTAGRLRETKEIPPTKRLVYRTPVAPPTGFFPLLLHRSANCEIDISTVQATSAASNRNFNSEAQRCPELIVVVFWKHSV